MQNKTRRHALRGQPAAACSHSHINARGKFKVNKSPQAVKKRTKKREESKIYAT